MTAPRLDHPDALLSDGTVLIASIQKSGSDGGRAFASAGLYDPATGTFSATGDMATPRFGQAATCSPMGRVLIAGGGAAGASDELYHPTVLAPAPTEEIASPSNPAIAGEALVMYTTSLVDGGVIPPERARPSGVGPGPTRPGPLDIP